MLCNGQTRHYELKVGDFDRLVVEDGINVVYNCSEDSAGMAVYAAEPQVADHLIFDTSKQGRLLIQKAFHGEGVLTEGLPTVYVYSKFLKRVQNGGDSLIVVRTVAACPEFSVNILGNGRVVVRDIHCGKFSGGIRTGNGQLIVNGVADVAVLNNTGVGSIQADKLKAGEASCRFFGTGTTGVWTEGVLTIKGMFPGKIYYRGTPEKIRNYSMGVKIMSLDHPEEDE